jgi:hypothetical protein
MRCSAKLCLPLCFLLVTWTAVDGPHVFDGVRSALLEWDDVVGFVCSGVSADVADSVVFGDDESGASLLFPSADCFRAAGAAFPGFLFVGWAWL